MRTKNIDLETLASKLDISPTMHKYAIDRYNGIADYLNSKGIDAKLYLQGSFRTGTVVRPLVDGKDADYDIDVVCQLNVNKHDTYPKIVKQCVGDILDKSDIYGDKLLPEESRCWTLEYKGVSNGIGFKLDIVPSVKEDVTYIASLIQKGVAQKHALDAISITERVTTENYSWIESNPAGFGTWFDDINESYLAPIRATQKRNIYSNYRNLFSAEQTETDVPDYFVRSPLQRVIQLLKRHRDIYYSRNEKSKKHKPISAIIVTLSAKIASEITTNDINELLKHIVYGMKDYATLLQGRNPQSRHFGEVRNYIEKRDSKWKILNPVNPDDNFADSWTDETAQFFFNWVDAVVYDLGNTTPANEFQYISGLQASFGKDFVCGALNIDSNYGSSTITSPTKAWSE